MTEGWPISDLLIFTDDQILTYSTETKTAENMRMLSHCSMINTEIGLLYHGTLPLALWCCLHSVVSLSSSPSTGRPASLDESCLNGPCSSEHLTAFFAAPPGSILHVLTLPGQTRTVIICLTVHVCLHGIRRARLTKIHVTGQWVVVDR